MASHALSVLPVDKSPCWEFRGHNTKLLTIFVNHHISCLRHAQPRIVVPGYPHHITQRGNRRQETFFCDDDYRLYINLMSGWCTRCGVDIWAYCLMPNNTHLIAVPRTENGMRKAIAHMPGQLIFVRIGEGICGRDGFTHS